MSERERIPVLLIGEEENLSDIQKGLTFQDFAPQILNYHHQMKDILNLLNPKIVVIEDVGERSNVMISEIHKSYPEMIILVVSNQKNFEAVEINSHQIPIKKTNHRLVQVTKMGADRYLDSLNPYLVGAEMRSFLRMVEPLIERVVKVGDLKVDLTKRLASREGNILNLSKQEWLLLKLFADHFENVLTFEQIIDLWHPEFEVSLAYLRVAINRLRKKIEIDPEKPDKIHNVVGVGYFLGEHPFGYEKGPDESGPLELFRLRI